MGDQGLFVNHEACNVCGCSKEQYYALKHRVEESKQRITLMESEFLQNTLYTENELEETRDELRLLQQKYNALEKSHQELHEVNQDLEERILDVAASYEKEKQALNREVLTLSQKLLDTRFEINKLEEKNQRYKKDCELAVQLLQCTPSGAYQQHKVSTLPNELQYYVHQIMAENVGGSGSQGNGNASNFNPVSPKNTNPKQPLLNSGDQNNAQYGLLSSRIYDTVPANVVARAIQRRDEAEKKEMEKLLQITSRRKKPGSNTVVVMHDKGVQTLYPYLSDKKYDVLCVKCGVNMRDVTLDEEDLEKKEQVEAEKTPEQQKEEETPQLVNLLDLSDTTTVQKPEPKENLLLDFLEAPNIPPEPPAEPVQTPGQALAELLFGSGEENKAEEDVASNAASSQGSATPGDSGVFDEVSPVTTEQPPNQESTATDGNKDEDCSSQPEAETAMNGKEEKKAESESEAEQKHHPEEEEKTNGTSNETPSETKPPAKGSLKPPPNKGGSHQIRKPSPRINKNQISQRNQNNRPLVNKPKNPMDSNQLKPGKPEAKVSPVTKTIEPPVSKMSPKPKSKMEEPIPKATQVKSQGQHYMQTSV